MKILFSTLLIVGLITPAANSSSANPWKKVGHFVEKNLSHIASAISGEDLSSAEWNLNAVFIRLQAQFGIEVPWAAQLRVVPELEVIFEPDDVKN